MDKVPHMFPEGASIIINDRYNSDRAKHSYWGGRFWPVLSKLAASPLLSFDRRTR